MTVIGQDHKRVRMKRAALDRVALVDGPLPDVKSFDRETFDGVPCRTDRMLWADQRPGEDTGAFEARLGRASDTCRLSCSRVRECRALAKSLGWPEGVWGGLIAGYVAGLESAVTDVGDDDDGVDVLAALAETTGVEWRRIPDVDYAVSADGRVVRLGTGRVLRPYMANSALSVRAGKVRKSVHLLVLEAFGGPRPRGMVAGRLNGDLHDNRIENLRWVPRHRTTARETHCKRGHAYDAENTYLSPAGLRRCCACRALRLAEMEAGADPLPGCQNGHEFDDENTYWDPAGRRRCRECRAMGDRKRDGKQA